MSKNQKNEKILKIILIIFCLSPILVFFDKEKTNEGAFTYLTIFFIFISFIIYFSYKFFGNINEKINKNLEKNPEKIEKYNFYKNIFIITLFYYIFPIISFYIEENLFLLYLFLIIILGIRNSIRKKNFYYLSFLLVFPTIFLINNLIYK